MRLELIETQDGELTKLSQEELVEKLSVAYSQLVREVMKARLQYPTASGFRLLEDIVDNCLRTFRDSFNNAIKNREHIDIAFDEGWRACLTYLLSREQKRPEGQYYPLKILVSVGYANSSISIDAKDRARADELSLREWVEITNPENDQHDLFPIPEFDTDTAESWAREFETAEDNNPYRNADLLSAFLVLLGEGFTRIKREMLAQYLRQQRQLAVSLLRSATNRNQKIYLAKAKTAENLKRVLRSTLQSLRRTLTTELYRFLHESILAVAEANNTQGYMARIPEPDACSACKSAFLQENGEPQLFPLNEVKQNAELSRYPTRTDGPVVGPLHPFCRCRLVLVPLGHKVDKEGNIVPDNVVVFDKVVNPL